MKIGKSVSQSRNCRCPARADNHIDIGQPTPVVTNADRIALISQQRKLFKRIMRHNLTNNFNILMKVFSECRSVTRPI